MTSGKFTSFPIDKVFVNRPERQRRELTGIVELADSIKRTGLIHPITITKAGELKTGERRWTACRSLGWTHITAQFLEDMDEAQLQLLELEENVRRVDLSWQDQCLAVERYHGLRARQNPKWNATKTAEALGLVVNDVLAKRSVAKELMAGNQRIMEAPRYTVARGINEREKERERTSTIAKIEAVTRGPPVEKVIPLLNVSFNEWVKTYEGQKFNFIHCDFPYGINADKYDQGAASGFGGYADGEDVYFELLASLRSAMNNVVAESAHLMFWFSMEFYRETFDALTEMGWTVSKFPLIWHKSDNMGILPDPSRGPRRIYETCLIASRGDRKIIRAVSNVVSHPTTKYIHMSEKPIGMLMKFMEMFVDKFTSGLDPTAGSANAIRAMAKAGATVYQGLEINTDFFNLAKEHFYD